MSRTRTVRFHNTGDASVLRIESLPTEEPKQNEVRIKVAAIGLNRAEIMFRNGAYLETPEFPSRLGYEAAGIIEAIGKGVKNFKIGDRVSTIPAFSMGRYGVYAETAVVPVEAVAHCPPALSLSECTAIWMQYITAYGALVEIGNLLPGQQVLITAASSSVGVAAIQLAKQLGAEVIATTRNENKKNFLLNQGADYVINTDAEDIVSKIKHISSGKGVELVFDPIGGPILMQLSKVASMGGQIIEYGALDNELTPFPLFEALSKGLTIRGYTLFEITKNKKKLEQAKDYLFPLLSTGVIKPVIDKVFLFEEVRKAHEYMESNQHEGKIVINL